VFSKKQTKTLDFSPEQGRLNIEKLSFDFEFYGPLKKYPSSDPIPLSTNY
jgi:hypothetical protein